MKTRSLAAAVLAATAVIGFPKVGLCVGANYGAPVQTYEQSNQQTRGMQNTLTSSEIRKHDALMTLRDEGLKLRDADGGTLTPEHRAYLQSRLDAIQAGNY